MRHSDSQRFHPVIVELCMALAERKSNIQSCFYLSLALIDERQSSSPSERGQSPEGAAALGLS